MTLERCKINYFFSLKSLNLHLEELVEMANPLLSKKPKEKLKVRQLNVKMWRYIPGATNLTCIGSEEL